jgi:hypothetical protein
MVTTAAYIWMAICAVSHVRIDAKKKGEDLSLKSQGIWYAVQIIFYWILTSLFII